MVETGKQNFMPGIKDKVVVITGARRGIGEATAVMLAERGAKVLLPARGLDRLETVTRRIARAGGEPAYARTDVRRRKVLPSLVKATCGRYGQLDVLITMPASCRCLPWTLARGGLGGHDRHQHQHQR